MDRILIEDMEPYVRDVAVCVIPRLTDEQLEQIGPELMRLSPFVRIRRLTENTFLAEGIRVFARSTHKADALTWDIVACRVREGLRASLDVPGDITSIDVRDPSGVLV